MYLSILPFFKRQFKVSKRIQVNVKNLDISIIRTTRYTHPIYDKTFDFLAYKHEMRRAKLMDWCKERQRSIKIVGTGIEPPEDHLKRHLWKNPSSNHSEFSRSLDDSENIFMLPYYLKVSKKF